MIMLIWKKVKMSVTFSVCFVLKRVALDRLLVKSLLKVKEPRKKKSKLLLRFCLSYSETCSFENDDEYTKINR